jgi:hypothetical protein
MSVLYAVLCAGGSVPQQMTPAVNLVRLPEGALQPQIAIGLSGRVHVVYFTGEAAGGDLFYAQIRPTTRSPRRCASTARKAVPSPPEMFAARSSRLARTTASMWCGTAPARPSRVRRAVRRQCSIPGWNSKETSSGRNATSFNSPRVSMAAAPSTRMRQVESMSRGTQEDLTPGMKAIVGSG